MSSSSNSATKNKLKVYFPIRKEAGGKWYQSTCLLLSYSSRDSFKPSIAIPSCKRPKTTQRRLFLFLKTLIVSNYLPPQHRIEDESRNLHVFCLVLFNLWVLAALRASIFLGSQNEVLRVQRVPSHPLQLPDPFLMIFRENPLKIPI
jgi:hypothetical protein